MFNFTHVAAAAAFALAATSANATIAVVFDGFDGGFASFAATVTAAGGTQTNRVLVPGEVGNFGDFTITRTGSGANASVGSIYNLFGASPARAMTGGAITINPVGPFTNPRGNPLLYRDSGVTLTFANPINALGFEVGDWATCCQPSDLYIQFGSNAPITVGQSRAFGDTFLTNGGSGVFVAAFDDTDTFTTVSFWGDGVGEFLVMGGTIRYALVPKGSLPGGIPEPATWAMMIAGFGLVGAAARRRRSVTLTAA